jgi:hypothetical protein
MRLLIDNTLCHFHLLRFAIFLASTYANAACMFKQVNSLCTAFPIQRPSSPRLSGRM